MSALIQIVDEQDMPTGSATIDDAQAKGQWHRLVHIMVEDKYGNLLLQKRGPNMRNSPNCWDTSAAGHVDAGESYEQAAHRELAEETGIESVALQEIDSYKSQKTDGTRVLNRFRKVYRARVDRALPLKPQTSEVAELRWFAVAEAKKFATDHPSECTSGLLRELARL